MEPNLEDKQKDETEYAQYFSEGLKLHKNGRLDEAARYYNRVLEQKPDHPQALHFLGAIATEKRQFEKGKDLIMQALEIKPDMPDALYNLALTYQRQDDWDNARNVYKKLIEMEPDHMEGLQNSGIAYERLGELEKSLEYYDQVLDLDPDNEPVLLNKGSVLNRLDRYDQALQVYEKLLRLNPEKAQVHHDQAVVFLRQEKDEAAKKGFLKALDLREEYAEAHNGLGVVLMQQGDFDESRKHLMRAVALKPDFLKAYYHLASNTKDLGNEYLDKLNTLRKKSLTLEERTHLYFALGKLYEGSKNWKTAFYFYQIANNNRKQNLEEQFDFEDHRKQTAVLIAGFNKKVIKELPDSGLETTKPIFIVGMPRSGTTLTEQIISSHPRVYGAGELMYMGDFLRDFINNQKDKPLKTILEELTRETCLELSEKYLEKIDSIAPDSEFVTDKMPFNFRNLGFISLLFPNARIIHCKRNPYDTCISCFFQNFSQGNQYSFNIEDQGKTYSCYERLMAHWHQVLPVSILDLEYEKLVGDPEAQIRRLLDFCQLEWDERCLDFHKSKRAVRTASLGQVRQKIYTSSTKKWERYSEGLFPLQKTLGDPQLLETGRILQGLGKVEHAAEIYERVKNVHPENANAWHLLGLTHHINQEYDVAGECIQEAIARDDEQAIFHANLGLVMKAIGRIDSAEDCQRKAVEKDPESVINHRQLSNVLRLRGKLDEAILEVDKALELDENDTPSLLLKAQVLQQKKDFYDALLTVQKAKEKSPESTTVMDTLASILVDAGQVDKAVPLYKKIVEAEPDKAVHYLKSADMYFALSEPEKAAADYFSCLSLDPRQAEAYYGLSRLNKISTNDKIFSTMKQIAYSDDLSIAEKIPVFYALGNVMEIEKQHENAFNFWAEANKLYRRRLLYTQQQETARWHHARNFFTKEMVSKWPDATDNRNDVIFLLGMPCSGIQLLDQVLSEQFKIRRLGNSPILPRIAQKAYEEFGFEQGYPVFVPELNEEHIKLLGDRYLLQARYIAGDQRACFLDMQYYNAYYLGLVRKILPDSKVVYCRRDPLDICAAAYAAYENRDYPFVNDLEELARMSLIYNQSMQHWHDLFPDWILQIDYEDIFNCPEDASEKIDQHCRLDLSVQKIHSRLIDFQKGKDRTIGGVGKFPGFWQRYKNRMKPAVKIIENEDTIY